MLNKISCTQMAGAWIAAVIVIIACAVVAGADITVSAGELWLVAAVVPPAVMLLLWHGAPPVTAADLLYAVDTPSKEGRP